MDPIPTTKRGNPAMQPGKPSLNPTGRPKGAAGLARYIAELTDDGRELVDRLLSLSRDPRAPVREASAATYALLDRLAGKPMAPAEISLAVTADAGLQYPGDWPRLAPGDRATWLMAHRDRLLGAGGDK